MTPRRGRAFTWNFFGTFRHLQNRSASSATVSLYGGTSVACHRSRRPNYYLVLGLGGRRAPASNCGDAVILSGDVGRHGIAVLAAREGLGFESAITSDCAPLTAPIHALFEAGIAVHCLRDLTRGGLAGGLIEIAETAGLAIEISERAVPVREDVGSACEVLGLDPFHIANEGRFVAFVSAGEAARAIASVWRCVSGAGAVARHGS